MAYKIQKGINGEQEIIINGWENGIATSALKGFQNMVNVDIWTSPNFVQPQGMGTSATLYGGAFTKLVTYFVYNPVNTTYYALMNDG